MEWVAVFESAGIVFTMLVSQGQQEQDDCSKTHAQDPGEKL